MWGNRFIKFYGRALLEEGRVKERLKFVRASFAQCVNTSDTHWLDRPIVPNQISIPIECIFEEQLPGNNHTMR